MKRKAHRTKAIVKADPDAAAYWAEYHAAKQAALKMAANLSSKEKGYAVTATRRTLINAAVHDQTEQRRFERRFLSLEFPKDDGVPYDYTFGNREVNRLIRDLDARFRAHLRNLRFNAALKRLQHHPELQETLRAIRRHVRRAAILRELNLTRSVYRRRFCDIVRLLALDTHQQIMPLRT